MDWELVARLGGVLLVDLILAGDNALVIAMAARKLEGSQRRKAILYGAAGAIVLRLLFAAVVTYLLLVPFLQVAGALILLWIAWKLVTNENGGDDKVEVGESVWSAVKIIIIADAVMSLDNVIALVAVSGGNLWLIGAGIAITIPLVIWGATLLASLLDRLPWLVYAGSGLLVYIAVEMFFADRAIHDYVEPLASIEWLIGLTAAAAFIAVVWFRMRRTRRGVTQ